MSMFKNERIYFNSAGLSTDSVRGELRKELVWSGMVANVLAGEALSQGNIIYPVRNGSDSEWKKIDADAIATGPGLGYVLKGCADEKQALIMLDGYIRDDALALGLYSDFVLTFTDGSADTEAIIIGDETYEVDLDAGGVTEGNIALPLVTGSITKEDMAASFETVFNANTTTYFVAVDNDDGTVTLTSSRMNPLDNAVTVNVTGHTKCAKDGNPAGGQMGGNIYSSLTAGGITMTAPSASNDYTQKLGFALNNTELIFRPSFEYTIN